jgi:heavy metal sensor kinase
MRLTCWYFAMFASASALLCVTSLWMLQRSVDDTEYHEMQERADDVRVVLSHEGAGRNPQQLGSDLAAIYHLKDDGKYLQVRDEKGNWLFRSSRMIEENPDLPAASSLPKAGLISEFHQGIHQVRTLSYPITVHGEHYSVQTGIALDKSIALLASFRTKLSLFAPILILLATLGGHAMSRKALFPVARLAAEVQRINDRNLDIRLPVSKAKDEISDLSRTLNQMLERIDKAFASVRAFTGNASHELRTPISLLRTEIEVALYRPRKAEEYRSTLGLLHDETMRMTDLVENLLSLARTDAGAETITLTPIDLRQLLRRLAGTWKSVMDQAGLVFAVEIPNERVIVLGDEDSMHRLFSILLENAAKFTPSGGSIRIATTVRESRVVFSAKDSGLGIAPEHKQHIFDRFYRVVPVGGSPAKGSGLGLALAKWIAERHGTELKVESEPGIGSNFSFCLQRADQALPAKDELSASNDVSRRAEKIPS